MTIVCVLTPKVVALRSTQPSIILARTSEGVGRSMDHLVPERWSDGATAVGCAATGTRRRVAAASVPWEAASVPWEADSVECKAWRPDRMHKEVKGFSLRDP